jgi:hypothetical protein
MIIKSKRVKRVKLCPTCLGEHDRDVPHRPPVSASVLLDRLFASTSPTSRNVLLLLRMSLVPEARIDAQRAMESVGNEYAEHGRLRSQAIQRTMRRAHCLALSSQPRRFEPTSFGKDCIFALRMREGGGG